MGVDAGRKARKVHAQRVQFFCFVFVLTKRIADFFFSQRDAPHHSYAPTVNKSIVKPPTTSDAQWYIRLAPSRVVGAEGGGFTP